MKKFCVYASRGIDYTRLRKILLTMKLSVFLFLLGILSVQANEMFSQTSLNLQLEKASLEEVLEEIQEQTDFGFIYDYEYVKEYDAIDVDFHNASMDAVLYELLKETNLDYRLEEKMIVLFPREIVHPKASETKTVTEQEKKVIKGTVTDDQGIPLPGVSVVIRGTNTGVATDIDGNYSLEIEGSNAVLIFSFVGMLPQEIAYKGQVVQNVILKADSEQMDEVVVTGYTQQKKVTYTGASVTLKPDALQKNNVETSFLKTLQGQAPGVLVMDNPRGPDSEPTIRIRGTGSIDAGQSPLIIMDGIAITDPNIINAADVESVTVQKDATATAIYGSRGSNGVIIITTKKGMPGKPRVNYEFKQGFGFVEQGDVDVMNSDQKLAYEVDLGIKTQEEADEWLDKGYETDWKDRLYQTAKSQDHNLSISGGTAASRYSFSLGYRNEETNYDSSYERFTGRLNLDSKLTDKLTVGANVLFSRSDHEDNREGREDQFSMVYNPYENEFDENGEYNRYISGEENILFVKDNLSSVEQSNSFNAVAYASYKILPELTFRSQWGISYSNSDSERFRDPSAARSWLPDNQKGDLTNSYYKHQSITGTQTLNYTKIIESTHYIKALVGMEFVENKSKYFSGTGQGYSSGKVKTLSAAASAQYVRGGGSHSGLLSYFSQFSYSYKEKFFTDFSFRRDGSSNFGENQRYANFWSLGGGWNIHKEAFMSESFIDQLKLRGSIGTAGNSNIRDFLAKMLFAADANYAGYPGIYPDRLDNKDLTWEQNRNIGIGLDYALFNSRIRGTIDYYKRTTTDLLLGINPLGTSGFAGNTGATNYTDNIGEMYNKGVDLSLSVDVLRKKDLEWTLSLNLSYNKNEITKLYEGEDLIYGDFTNSIGHSFNSLYLAKWKGVDAETGMNQYEDENGDLTTSSDYKQVVGDTQPPYYGGFISNLRYKNFELYALFSFAQDQYTLNSALHYLYNNPRVNQSTDVLNAWKQEGDVATIAKRSSGYFDKDPLNTTQFMQDASFIRLKTLSLTYNLPAALLKKVNVENARVYVQGQNLLTWTDLKVGNPEFAGIRSGYSPNVQRVLFGINVSF